MSKAQKILSLELHKPKRIRFHRRSVITNTIDDLWQADLVDMQELSRWNKGYKYMLTVICTFSKFAFAVPLKDKTGKSVSEAFKNILKNKRRPKNLQTDKGLEFFNSDFRKLCLKHGINHYHTFNSSTKASIVERWNRTLKTKMWRKFTELNTFRWIDLLKGIVSDYNHTVHSSIKMKPVHVNKRNVAEVWLNLRKRAVKKAKKTKTVLRVGDIVRISKEKGLFTKGYKFNWSEELFKISKILRTRPETYKLTDMKNDSVAGTFYLEELQKTKIPDYARIEKVLRRRVTVGGKKEIFVQWKGYSNDFNEWISADKAIKL